MKLYYYFWFNILFACLQLIKLYAEENKADDKANFLIRTIKQCERKEDLPIQIYNVTVNQMNKDKFIMDGHLVIKEEVGPEIMGTITAQYCKDVDVPDSCEYIMQDYVFGDVCELMKDESGEWNIFVKNINISPQCPIKPAELKINNLEVFNPYQKNLPLPEGLWKAEMRAFINDTEKACAYMEILI